VGSYYANAGKSAFKGRIEKRAGLALLLFWITADLRWAIGMNPYKQPPGYCFNTDCVDFCVPLGILLLEVKQLM
jgi:hypothetical protein